jgi:hypothetical protein
MKTVQIKTDYNQLLTLNPAHKSGDAWIRIASSVQSRTLAQSFFNALPAETARWKRCVPRFAPINVLIAMDFYLHSLQITEEGRGLLPSLCETSAFSAPAAVYTKLLLGASDTFQ